MASPDLIGSVRRVAVDTVGTNTLSGVLADARIFEEAV
jgi:hypothetical protein